MHLVCKACSQCSLLPCCVPGAVQDRASRIKDGIRRTPAQAATATRSLLSSIVPTMRVWLQSRLAGVQGRLRKVASVVFQGGHVVSQRQPVRQYSVKSDRGVEEPAGLDAGEPAGGRAC